MLRGELLVRLAFIRLKADFLGVVDGAR